MYAPTNHKSRNNTCLQYNNTCLQYAVHKFKLVNQSDKTQGMHFFKELEPLYFVSSFSANFGLYYNITVFGPYISAAQYFEYYHTKESRKYSHINIYNTSNNS